MIFRKWGGGVKGRLELFQKFIRFGMAALPLKGVVCCLGPSETSRALDHTKGDVLSLLSKKIGGWHSLSDVFWLYRVSVFAWYHDVFCIYVLCILDILLLCMRPFVIVPILFHIRRWQGGAGCILGSDTFSVCFSIELPQHLSPFQIKMKTFF